MISGSRAAGGSSGAAELILLEDVPAAQLSWPVVSALSRAAAWDGRGLLFVGGPHSFTVAWLSRQFHDSNPKLYRALVDALLQRFLIERLD